MAEWKKRVLLIISVVLYLQGALVHVVRADIDTNSQTRIARDDVSAGAVVHFEGDNTCSIHHPWHRNRH